MKEFTGDLTAENKSFAIVVSRFNETITKNLLAGALDCLTRSSVDEERIHVVWVPGAFEVPLIAKTLAQSNQYHAVITLGCVIRGATSHYDHVCSQVAAGVTQASLNSSRPVIFGILTTDTIEQAVERSGTKAGNKGFEAAQAAIEMASLCEKLQPVQTH